MSDIPCTTFLSTVTEIYNRVAECKTLTYADRQRLQAAIVENDLPDEDYTRIDQILYNISRGKVQVIECPET